jgi:hypothetical protein
MRIIKYISISVMVARTGLTLHYPSVQCAKATITTIKRISLTTNSNNTRKIEVKFSFALLTAATGILFSKGLGILQSLKDTFK